MAYLPYNLGVGAFTTLPSATTNGTALGTMPSGASGARFYLPSGASVTFTIAATAPASAPTNTMTVTSATTGPNWDEYLAAGQMIYITASSYSLSPAFFRWI